MMYKAICSRILTELQRNTLGKSLYFHLLSPISLPFLRKEHENYLHTKSIVSNEVKANNRNELLDLSEERHLPRTMRLQKYVPDNFLVKTRESWKIHEALTYLYEDLCDEIDYMTFFKEFNMSDTFSSWFTVMELHVYLLCCRIMQEGPEVGVLIRNHLTDIFWNDVQIRGDKLQIAGSVLNKQLRGLSNQFQAAFYGYDEGVQTNDMVLAAIVWRRFFAFECDDAIQIERVVKYIRLQLNILDGDSLSTILYRRRKLFIPLQDVTIP